MPGDIADHQLIARQLEPEIIAGAEPDPAACRAVDLKIVGAEVADLQGDGQGIGRAHAVHAMAKPLSDKSGTAGDVWVTSPPKTQKRLAEFRGILRHRAAPHFSADRSANTPNFIEG